eukprot:scaffold4175_cov201-Ochromonas_danica.AAC.3
MKSDMLMRCVITDQRESSRIHTSFAKLVLSELKPSLFTEQTSILGLFMGGLGILFTWNNPDFQSMNNRLKSKGVEGNLRGEGLLKGGL